MRKAMQVLGFHLLQKLEEREAGVVKSEELARELKVSVKLVRRLVRELDAAGIIQADVRKKVGITFQINPERVKEAWEYFSTDFQDEVKRKSARKREAPYYKEKVKNLDCKDSKRAKALFITVSDRRLLNLTRRMEIALKGKAVHATRLHRKVIHWAVFNNGVNPGRVYLSCALADFYATLGTEHKIDHQAAWLMNVSTRNKLILMLAFFEFLQTWLNERLQPIKTNYQAISVPIFPSRKERSEVNRRKEAGLRSPP